MDGTDTSPRPVVPNFSTENLSPIEGSERETCRWELHVRCRQSVSSRHNRSTWLTASATSDRRSKQMACTDRAFKVRCVSVCIAAYASCSQLLWQAALTIQHTTKFERLRAYLRAPRGRPLGAFASRGILPGLRSGCVTAMRARPHMWHMASDIPIAKSRLRFVFAM